MDKIRKYLIHLLGGVTEEELDWSIKYAVRRTGAYAADAMLLYMKTCYGLKSDEWCKKVYDYTRETYERATKNLKEYVNSSKNTVAGRINDARDRDRY